MVFLSKVSGNILKARLQLQHTAPGQPHGPLGCTFRDTDVRTWLADGDHSRRVGIEERDAARPAGVGSLCGSGGRGARDQTLAGVLTGAAVAVMDDACSGPPTVPLLADGVLCLGTCRWQVNPHVVSR